MSVYLHDIPLEEALLTFHNALEKVNLWQRLESEEIPLDEHAAGRVLSSPVWAKISSPHYHASAMDGYAIKADDTEGALPSQPVILQIGSKATYVDTGDPLPDRSDAVIPIENVEPVDEEGNVIQTRLPFAIRIRAAAAHWSHIRPMGEDIVATELVLPEGKVLRPVDLGALAASGHTLVNVSRKPIVGIIPTGTELISIGEPVHQGDIIEFNSCVLAAQINEWGGQALRHSIVKDDFSRIQSAVREMAAHSDLILLNAGSSAGSEDFSSRVIESLGEVLVHGIAVRPGHPVILGIINADGKHVPAIGVPGYPVSAALTTEVIIEPLLARWLGRPPQHRPTVNAAITKKTNSPAGDDDFLRVSVGKVGNRILAAPLSRGAGMITSLVRADGIVKIPRGIQGLSAGSDVKVELFNSVFEIENTILVIGSHDMTLDLLAQYLTHHGRRLASVHVGSQGGLISLNRGETHLAGSHLLDPETGEYNLSYIRDYCKDVPVSVFGWVGRKQGLLVQKGNPKNLQSLKDLTRKEITYVNRQRGAGTRVLLDYQLSLLGLEPESISGYKHEEFTHLAVAAAISSGRSDCGLGVAAAAKALDLDFVPLYDESYQLVIPRAFVDSDLLDPLFTIARDKKFQQAILGLPGYDVSHMGEFIANVG